MSIVGEKGRNALSLLLNVSFTVTSLSCGHFVYVIEAIYENDSTHLSSLWSLDILEKHDL